MRWVCYLLIMANLVLFGWQMLVGPAKEVRLPTVAPSGEDHGQPEIKLFSELDPGSKNKLNKGPVGMVCHWFGPFASPEEGSFFLAQLEAQGVVAKIDVESVASSVHYWGFVQSVADPSEAQALVSRLRNAGIDAGYITSGPLAGGIDLGRYESEAPLRLLQTRFSPFLADVQVVEKRRDFQRFWLVARESVVGEMQKPWPQSLHKAYPDIIHQEKLCKPVA